MDNRKRAQKIIGLLTNEHPDARIAISFQNPLELLVATILSAQSTDMIVNKVTKSLFKKYRKAEDYGNADLHELENDIRSTGFYHVKAKYLKKMGLFNRYDGASLIAYDRQIFVNKILPFFIPIIIGDILIDINASDEISKIPSGIESVELYIDGMLKASLINEPYQWL